MLFVRDHHVGVTDCLSEHGTQNPTLEKLLQVRPPVPKNVPNPGDTFRQIADDAVRDQVTCVQDIHLELPDYLESKVEQ